MPGRTVKVVSPSMIVGGREGKRGHHAARRIHDPGPEKQLDPSSPWQTCLFLDLPVQSFLSERFSAEDTYECSLTFQGQKERKKKGKKEGRREGRKREKRERKKKQRKLENSQNSAITLSSLELRTCASRDPGIKVKFGKRVRKEMPDLSS